jgi:hypothetical protein
MQSQMLTWARNSERGCWVPCGLAGVHPLLLAGVRPLGAGTEASP